MISVNPYLNFKGNTEEAMKFYSAVFGNDLAALMHFNDNPASGYEKMPQNEQGLIMHSALPLGQNLLMATDALESMGHHLTMGNNFSLCINTESQEETDKLFDALSAGGLTQMKPEKTFWGDYFAMCTDKFGIQWMLSYRPQ